MVGPGDGRDKRQPSLGRENEIGGRNTETMMGGGGPRDGKSKSTLATESRHGTYLEFGIWDISGKESSVLVLV
eukprot:scaffold682614_cov69-Prasinocladus_malaysianus.AAC.1